MGCGGNAADHMGDVGEVVQAWCDSDVAVKTEIRGVPIGLASRPQNRGPQASEQLRERAAAVALAEDEQLGPGGKGPAAIDKLT